MYKNWFVSSREGQGAYYQNNIAYRNDIRIKLSPKGINKIIQFSL